MLVVNIIAIIMNIITQYYKLTKILKINYKYKQ